MPRPLVTAGLIVLLGGLCAGVVLVDPAGWFRPADNPTPLKGPPTQFSQPVGSGSEDAIACSRAMMDLLDEAIQGGNNPAVVEEVTDAVAALLGEVPESFWPTVGTLQTTGLTDDQVSERVGVWCA